MTLSTTKGGVILSFTIDLSGYFFEVRLPIGYESTRTFVRQYILIYEKIH